MEIFPDCSNINLIFLVIFSNYWSHFWLYYAGADLGILEGGGGVRVLEKPGPWEFSD